MCAGISEIPEQLIKGLQKKKKIALQILIFFKSSINYLLNSYGCGLGLGFFVKLLLHEYNSQKYIALL